MRTLIYIMTPVLILTIILASRFVTWDRLKGVDRNAVIHLTDGITNGTKLLNEGKRYDAIKMLTQVIEVEPRFAEAYIMRGLAYYQLAHYKEAIADFTETISLKKYAADAYARRGDVHRTLNDIDNAINDYSASLKRSKNASVLSKRGKCYLETGRFQDAISDYSYVVKHRPNAIAYYNRGKAYYESYQNSDKKTEILDLALDDSNKAIELQPKFAIAYLLRGDVHGQLQQYETQKADYTQAIVLLTDTIQNWKNQPQEYMPILLWRAHAYQKQDQTDKVEDDVLKIYQLFSDYCLKRISFSGIL